MLTTAEAPPADGTFIALAFSVTKLTVNETALAVVLAK
jgi:hypothetical protein